MMKGISTRIVLPSLSVVIEVYVVVYALVSTGSPCLVVALALPVDLTMSSILRVVEGAAVEVLFAVAAYADLMTSSGMGLPATPQYACTGNKSLKSMLCLSLQFLTMQDTAAGRYALLWLASQMHLLEVQPLSVLSKHSSQQSLRTLNKSKRGDDAAETPKAIVAKVTTTVSDVGRIVLT